MPALTVSASVARQFVLCQILPGFGPARVDYCAAAQERMWRPEAMGRDFGAADALIR